MNKKILVVEDDVDISDFVKSALELENYNAVICENGKRALDYLEMSQADDLPHCILLDIMMPVMNGFQFLDRLKNHSDEALAKIPIILTTAKGSAVDIKNLPRELKVLKKPYELDELYNQISVVLTGTKKE